MGQPGDKVPDREPTEIPEREFRQSREFQDLQQIRAAVKLRRQRERAQRMREHGAMLAQTFAELPLALSTPSGMALGVAVVASVVLVIWSMG